MTTSTPDAAWPRGSRLPGPRRLARLSRAELYDRPKAGAPLGALLLLTAGLYLWGLSHNGNGNQYYAAAVQAGTHSWKAFLFGSLDAANYITVDKPPASLWLMELSSRLFGFSSFSMLLPQALEGVAAVALLYATVRRWFGRPAALLSGLILAVTPVAALMFRFNDPDALLVLLLVVAAYSVTRALERGGTRWLVFAGTALGFAFLTKMLQGFLILPALGLVYLVAAPVALGRRLWQLCLAGLAIAVSAGWWVALVELWPASARPYVGGSSNDSILQLVFGYNGLDRLSGASGGGGVNFSGTPGVLRLFNSAMGGQISWLLPASLIVLVAGGVWTARRPRTDRTRAAILLWGGWLLVSAVIYSFMTGIIHPYYTNTLAPAIAVILGVGATLLWGQRRRFPARLTLAVMLIATVVWSYLLLNRTATWHGWLRFAVLAGGVATAIAIVAAGARLQRAVVAAVAATGLLASLAGPIAYTLSVATTAQSGATVSAGPAIASAGPFGRGSAGGPGGEASPSRTLVSRLEKGSSGYAWVAATSSAQTGASLELATGKSVMAIGGFSGSDSATTLASFEKLVAQGKIHYYVASGGFGGGFTPPGGGFTPPSGGFRPGSGTGGGGPRNQGVASTIQTWVSTHFKSTTVSGSTVYDLTHRTG